MYKKKELAETVSNSYSKAEVLRAYGLPSFGGNYRTLDRYLTKYNISTEHFVPYKNFKPPKPYTRSLEDILVINSTYTNSHKLKQRLIKEGLLEEKCNICHIAEWNNKPLSLHLDHINGKKQDNRIENLRILCPNCHSQTPTYAGKNKGC